MRTLFTEIINSLSVNGNFAQDKFIIGNGIDEIIELKLNNSASIRYTPGENGAANLIEYSNDGIIWNSFDNNNSIEYEPIEFTESNLTSGLLTINHNFNNSNIMCLGYSVIPKDITYQDNSVIFDYSDQSTISGAVWFINSAQNMLANPPTPNIIIVSDAGSPEINGQYTMDNPPTSLDEITTQSILWSTENTRFTYTQVGYNEFRWSINWISAGAYYMSNELFTSTHPTKWPWECTWILQSGNYGTSPAPNVKI